MYGDARAGLKVCVWHFAVCMLALLETYHGDMSFTLPGYAL